MKSKLKNSQKPSKSIRSLAKWSLFLILFLCIERFCYFQTGGFRFYEILSDRNYDSKWDTETLSDHELDEIRNLLNQPFHFLGGGGQCYAFESLDGSVVLKFFRHDYLRPEALLRKISFPSFLEPLKQTMLNLRSSSVGRCLAGAKIAFEELKEETGMLYVHLNKTEGLFQTLTFTDKIGVKHTIDIDKTEFTLQKKAELIFSKIEREIRMGNKQNAKMCIKAFFEAMIFCAKKGILDQDTAIRRNFGFINEKAVFIDTGSLIKDESIKEATNLKNDLMIKSRRLYRWIRKHHPEYIPFFEKQLIYYTHLLGDNSSKTWE